jgi:PPOX class probable F420-dependent enzyme
MNRRTDTDVLTDTNRDLLTRTIVGHLATRRSDGTLQSNPVWFEWDGERLRLSQMRGRQKLRNMERDPHVALSVTDPDDPYRYLEVRGEVERIDDDPDHGFLDDLSERYTGQRPYPEGPGVPRAIVVIRPTGSSAQAA